MCFIYSAEQQIRLSTGEPKSHPYIGTTVGVNSGTSTSSNMSHNSSKRNKNYTPLDNRSLDLLDRITEISIERYVHCGIYIKQKLDKNIEALSSSLLPFIRRFSRSNMFSLS